MAVLASRPGRVMAHSVGARNEDAPKLSHASRQGRTGFVPRRLKTAAELTTLLNAELRKHDACVGARVDGITPVGDERLDYTWTATVLRKSAAPVPGQCSRIFLAAVRVLQQQYDLAPEE